MALTLPYPNLDFVPLDVLTAEEMNEIVANYTYIANQFPISSTNIATAGVTSNNIDWTTMGYLSLEKFYTSSPAAITSTTGVVIKEDTITVNSGRILVNATVNGTLNQYGQMIVYIDVDGVRYRVVATNNHTQAQNTSSGSTIISGLSAGSHSIKFIVAVDSGGGRSFVLSAYCTQQMTVVEI